MDKKIYCGNAKPFGKFNTLKVDICLDDIPEEFIKLGKNGKRYIKMNLNENKQVGKFGDTHNLTVDTWKPDHKPEYQGQREPEGFSTPPPPLEAHEDLPW